MNERLKEIFSKFKNGKALIIIGILGIALIGISSFLPSETVKQSKGQTLDTQSYLTDLERKVKKTVCAITGNNQVSVAITLENSVEYSYADEIKSDFTEKTQGSGTDKTDKNETQYITVKLADGSESALLVYTTIVGVYATYLLIVIFTSSYSLTSVSSNVAGKLSGFRLFATYSIRCSRSALILV